jgi:hypothetical protein
MKGIALYMVGYIHAFDSQGSCSCPFQVLLMLMLFGQPMGDGPRMHLEICAWIISSGFKKV